MIDKVEKYFASKGSKKELTVITPFLLDKPDMVYYIEKGSINLSSTYTEDKTPVGKLYNFTTLPNKQLFFGFPMAAKSTMMFFADAEEDSVIWELEIKDLIKEQKKNDDFKSEINKLLFAWIGNLYHAISDDTTISRPNNIEILGDQERISLKKDQFCSGVNGLCFIKTNKLSHFLFNSHIEIDYNKPIYFPITKDALFRIDESVECQIIKASDIEVGAMFWAGLNILHELVLLSDDFEANQYRMLDNARIERKYKLVKDDFDSVIQSAKGLLDRKTEFSYGFENDNDDSVFWKACQLVAQKQQITLKLPPKLNESTDAIQDITRFSGIRYREIILEGDWYNSKNESSFVGFCAQTNKPLAIISNVKGKTFAINVSTNERFNVNKKSVERVLRIGYVFYKPLADKKLNLKDLLIYAFANKKTDIKRLIIAAFMAAVLSMILPILNTIIFDEIIPNAQRSQLMHIAYALGVAAIGGVFFEISKSISIIRLRGIVDSNLQAAVWDRLLALPTEFFRKFTSGDLAERSLAVAQMVNLLSGVTLNSVISGVFTLFNFVLLFYLSPKLAAITLVLALVLIFTMLILGKKQVFLQNLILNKEGENSGFVLQLLTGIATLKISGNETKAFLQWFAKFINIRKFTIELERIQINQRVFTSSFYMLSIMIIYYAMIKLTDNLTTGRFLAFNAAYGAVVFALMEVSNSIIDALKIIPIYNRLKPIVEERPEDTGAKEAPATLKGNIELSNVNFRYGKKGPQILKNLSLNIKSGEYVALVGPSGCGKSTIIRLLLGFETPESGTIMYEGQDLNNIDVKLLRKQIGVVLQDGSLMSDDIFTNIIGSSTTLTIEDAWAAADAAAFADDIEAMPMGMFTIITDEGGTVSGGQKQRLMIARALVHKPKILIFDEATSALDNRTQAVVTDTLDGIQATRIVVAHRLSTIMGADRIIYIDKGEIQEQGAFHELMAKKGKFYSLAARQL